jgi:hypothetical protein
MLTTGMDNRARPGMAWVSLYRSKFLDCLAGAVQYSYRNVDLLWDNAIAGLGMAPLTVLAKPRPVANPSAGRGALQKARADEFG